MNYGISSIDLHSQLLHYMHICEFIHWEWMWMQDYRSLQNLFAQFTMNVIESMLQWMNRRPAKTGIIWRHTLKVWIQNGFYVIRFNDRAKSCNCFIQKIHIKSRFMRFLYRFNCLVQLNFPFIFLLLIQFIHSIHVWYHSQNEYND